MMHLLAQLSQIREVAPLISLAIVLVMPHWFSHDTSRAELVGPDTATVIGAVNALPYRIGSWSGMDVPVPESAVRLLRPNATVSRRFRDLDTGLAIELVLVHCGDARDMLGHYPPVCYPSAGWVFADRVDGRARGDRSTPVELTLGDRNFTASMYEFSRIEEWGMESSIRIFNFFVLADGRLSSDINDVNRRDNWLRPTSNSVGQVQLVTDGIMSLEDALASATSILQGSTEMFEALGVRTND